MQIVNTRYWHRRKKFFSKKKEKRKSDGYIYNLIFSISCLFQDSREITKLLKRNKCKTLFSSSRGSSENTVKSLHKKQEEQDSNPIWHFVYTYFSTLFFITQNLNLLCLNHGFKPVIQIESQYKIIVTQQEA